MQELIASYRMGKLQLMPGCDEDQSLEHEILGVLNQIRTTASEVMPCCLVPPLGVYRCKALTLGQPCLCNPARCVHCSRWGPDLVSATEYTMGACVRCGCFLIHCAAHVKSLGA